MSAMAFGPKPVPRGSGAQVAAGLSLRWIQKL
jgi:hypothetical protein